MKLLLVLALVTLLCFGIAKSKFIYFSISTPDYSCWANPSSPSGLGYIFASGACAEFQFGSYIVNATATGVLVQDFQSAGCQNTVSAINYPLTGCIILPDFDGLNSNSLLVSQVSVKNNNSDHNIGQEAVIQTQYSDSKCSNFLYTTIIPNYYSIEISGKNATYLCDDNNAAVVSLCVGDKCTEKVIQSQCNTQNQKIFCTKGN